MRLKSRYEFQKISKTKKRAVGHFLCIDFCPGEMAKLGLSVSARYGSAPQRNRFKRLVREAFRKNYSHLPPWEMNIIPRQFAKKAHLKDIENELKLLCS